MCDCSICIAEKEIRLCKNIAKFLQNLPFQLAKFCILDAKFEIFFCKKPRGQMYWTGATGKQIASLCIGREPRVNKLLVYVLDGSHE